MCLTKVYYNTYSDGTQDITEKKYPCSDGRACSHNEVRKYDRKFPFTKLGEVQPEPHRSLADRKPTPYFKPHTPQTSKSPSPPRRRSADVYMSTPKHYDHTDPYGRYDLYDYRTSSRRDPRDRYDREPRESRTKRSSTVPQIVYMDRDGLSTRSRSRSSSREYSRDVPLGVHLADDYSRRRHSSSRSRSRDGSSSRAGSSDHSDKYYRRRTDDSVGYVFVDDQDERRRQRRETMTHRRSSSYPDPSTSATADAYDPSRYIPRRAASSTVVHGSSSVSTSPPKAKHLRWEDEVRAKRDRQNAEIANRPPTVVLSEPTRGILKHTGDSKTKGKARETDNEIDELRRAVARMEIPSRGRDREPRISSRWYDEGGHRRSAKMVVAGDDRYGYY
ncbi:hypothetical protein N656DRAFT_772133 [Canariomyces notabilis]|uniref:Uncharacterized protein n=1 Tax=Canariomyces notabilis TaxID=2074819 RepID=A0AAN6QG18_9PEZI|nr:hypothetical protein N656DRAFT_772133 [Canariomyces arenarius]